MLPSSLVDVKRVEAILNSLDKQAEAFAPCGLRRVTTDPHRVNLVAPTQKLATWPNKKLGDYTLTPETVVAVSADKHKAAEKQSRSKSPARRSGVVELISDVSNNGEPVNYHVSMRIGSKQNACQLQIGVDTGSTKFWVKAVRSQEEKETLSADRQIYFPNNPDIDPIDASARDLNLEDSVLYADSVEVTMSTYQDHVEVGGLVSPHQELGAVFIADIANLGRLGVNTDGMLGLGLPSTRKRSLMRTPRKGEAIEGDGVAEDVSKDNLVMSLKKKRILEQAWCTLIGPWVSDAAYISAGATPGGERRRGFAVLGAPDRHFYDGPITWCDCLHRQYDIGWVIKLDAVKINGNVVFENQLALIDTGTSFVVVSPKTFSDVKMRIPGSQDVVQKSSASHGFRMFHHPIEAVKTMHFVFGGKDWEMLDDDITLGNTKGQTNVVSSIISLKGGKWDIGPENVWVLGGVFIDNYVTIFDFEKERIGFAKISSATFQDLDVKVPSYIEEISADG